MAGRSLRRRVFGLVPVLVAVAMLASACNYLDWGPGGPERPWWCDPTDTEINDGHGDGHGGHQHYTEDKGPLSAAQCLIVDYQFELGEAFANQFPTAGDAEDAGWVQLAPWIPGQGTHHMDPSYGIPTEFDGTRPSMLMYDSNGRDGQLTGMMYVVDRGPGSMPPEGFLGDNDHWHAHETLCYGPAGTIIGDSISDAACAARGGVNVDASGIWMVHVWLPVYDGWYASDIFDKNHPSIT